MPKKSNDGYQFLATFKSDICAKIWF